MRPIFASFKQILKQGLLLVLLAGLLNFASLFTPSVQPSLADVSSPAEEIKEIRKDLAQQDPEKLYEEATQPTADPKMEAEKKYEANLNEYYKENPDKAGILGEAKQLIEKITE